MAKPIVAIVGRPNVGKSTLFNRIVRKRRAIIEDWPGITRDRLYGDASWNGKSFIVVDTGGFQHDSQDVLSEEVKRQVMYAVEEADIVIMLMDADSGVLPLDIELHQMLRKQHKKTYLAVNKVDGPKRETMLMNDFFTLGVDLYPLSALNGYGYEHLMDSITATMPELLAEESPFPKIAIVGRPNVGKSTLVNALLSKDRMIVSATPGTTRDAVDSLCSYYGKQYLLVDTAGIRRRGKMARTVERYSFMRTLRNIEDCDVAVIVLDAREGIVELDQKIAGLVHSAKKGSIIVMNKWDLVNKDVLSSDTLETDVFRKLWFMRYAPMLTISALNRKRITKIYPLVDMIIHESSRRITTHELNVFLKNVLSRQAPPLYRGKRVKIYYIAQTSIKPPGFVLFTNMKAGMKEQYVKFLESQLREHFPFTGVPVTFSVREKRRK